MAELKLDVVTGVSGFTGKHIARRLLASGRQVLNLTGHPDRPTEFGDQVTSASYSFDSPEQLRKSLEGADTLYNTYWIRFSRGEMTFERAIENSRALVSAAKDAGIRRMVHVSIANPAEDSPLPYYRGKALVEKAIRESGLSYGILRPAVLFGNQGILINNIAWFLRHMPVFAIPGAGDYELQPIFVDDLADMAVEAGRSEQDFIKDAVGPEVYTMNDLVRLLAQTVRSKTVVVHVPGQLALLATGVLGAVLGDVVLTRDEVAGLEANLLVSKGPPTAATRLSDWLRQNAEWIGKEYMSEVKKHYG